MCVVVGKLRLLLLLLLHHQLVQLLLLKQLLGVWRLSHLVECGGRGPISCGCVQSIWVQRIEGNTESSFEVLLFLHVLLVNDLLVLLHLVLVNLWEILKVLGIRLELSNQSRVHCQELLSLSSCALHPNYRHRDFVFVFLNVKGKVDIWIIFVFIFILNVLVVIGLLVCSWHEVTSIVLIHNFLVLRELCTFLMG